MRTIKFRVWNSAKKEWFKPIYKAYKGELHDISISLSGQIIERTLTENADIRNNSGYIPMQFTGLLDKNGKEIYEGDIVIYTLTHDNIAKEIKATVEWYKHAWRLSRIWLFTEVRSIEVIGNIHEHKHLLEK